MKTNWLKRTLPSVYAGAGIAFAVAVLRGFFAADTALARYSALVDGFYIAGVLLISSFLMRMINRQGTFDVVAYNLKRLFPMGEKRFQEHIGKDAYTYSQEKREQRMKKDKGYPTLLVGLACMALATVFLILYMNAK